MATEARITQEYVEVLAGGNAQARLTQEYVEVLTSGNAQARITQEYVEVLAGADSRSRVTQEYVEVLASFRADLVESASNTLVFNQAAGVAKAIGTSSTLALTQTVSIELEVFKRLISTLVLNSVVTRNIVRAKSISNTVSLTGLALGINSKSALNNLIYSQSATYDITKRAQNVLQLTQTVQRNTILFRRVISLFECFQAIASGPNTFRRSLSNTLSYVGVATGNAVKLARTTVVFAQTVTVNKVRETVNSIAWANNAIARRDYTRNASNFFVVGHRLRVSKVKVLSANSVLSFFQVLLRQRIRTAVASSSLNLTQDLVQSRFFRSLNHNLTLNHTVVSQRIVLRSVTQSFQLTQSATLTRTANLSASSNLQFLSGHQKNIGFPSSGPITIIIPPVQAIIVKKLVILKGTNLAITLPRPEFDDSDAFPGKINILRFKTGSRKVYKTDTSRRVLSYTFVLQSKKITELKAFIAAYNSLPFNMENWKGELWYVLFNSNPFTFVEESYWEENDFTGKNKFRITLSMEGIRLN